MNSGPTLPEPEAMLDEIETYFLIYVSIAAHPFSKNELVELLKSSRQNNSAAGITGMLLYKDEKFMQLLEGEKDPVERTFGKILSDSRHRGPIVLLRGTQQERMFSDFSMGFENLNDESVRSLPGYSEYLDTSLSADPFSANPSSAQRLLRIFKRTGLAL